VSYEARTKDRIEQLLSAFQMGLRAGKEAHERFTDDYISNLAYTRNLFLAGAGFFVTLIFGLQQSNILKTIIPDRDFLYFLLVILIPSGVGYLVMTLLISKSGKRLRTIETEYLSGAVVQNFMKGFLNITNSDNIDWLGTLYNYYIVLEGAITSKLSDIHRDNSFPEKQGLADPVRQLYDVAIETAYQAYQSNTYLTICEQSIQIQVRR
jgi:hypothetical protein